MERTYGRRSSGPAPWALFLWKGMLSDPVPHLRADFFCAVGETKLAFPWKKMYNESIHRRCLGVSELRINEGNVEHCQALLAQLPGVFASGIRLDQGEMVEIHILASASRSAKQIVRDVQSAIFAVYGVEVDHRIISVAQLPQRPSVSETEAVAPVAQSVRLLFSGIESHRRDGVYRAGVYLTHDGESYTGEAQTSDTAQRRNRAIAQATINAVHAFLGRSAFELLDVKQAEFGGEAVVVTIVEQLGGAPSRILVGAVSQGEDMAESIVRSTLDAVNRRVGMLREGE